MSLTFRKIWQVVFAKFKEVILVSCYCIFECVAFTTNEVLYRPMSRNIRLLWLDLCADVSTLDVRGMYASFIVIMGYFNR